MKRRRRRSGGGGAPVSPLVLLLLALLLPSAAPAAAAAADADNDDPSHYEHAAVIDAGSTGSRLHLFRYRPGALAAGWAAVPLPDASLKATPGLSSFASEPRLAAASLRPLLKFLQQRVPRDQWAHTPVQLFATAGMRALPADAREAVLASVRRLLRKSGFQFDEDGWARAVSGREEALWAWVGVNYATGALPALLSGRNGGSGGQGAGGGKDGGGGGSSSPPPLLGVLELGGGSMQVALMPRGQPQLQQQGIGGKEGRQGALSFPRAAAAPLQLSGLAGLALYAESFDGLGLQAVLRRADAQALAAARAAVGGSAAAGGGGGAQAAAALGRKGAGGGGSAAFAFPESAPAHPCLPRGYVSPEGLRGAGGFDACAAALRRLVPLNGTVKGAAGGGGSSNEGAGASSSSPLLNDGRSRARCPYKRKQGGCVFGTAALRPPLLLSNSGEEEEEGALALIGLDNFFYAARALGLAARTPPPAGRSGSGDTSQSKNPTLAEFESAARALCAKPWAEQERAAGAAGGKAPIAPPPQRPRAGAASEQAEALAFLPHACAASAYVTLLLREGLGLPAGSRQVSFSNTVALAPAPAAVAAAAGGAGGAPPKPAAPPKPPPRPSSSFEATWTLGALLVEALELGGAVGVAGRDTAWGAVSAEGAASTSPAALAGAAALFCAAVMALMAAASYLQVGVAWPPPPPPSGPFSPSSASSSRPPRLSTAGGGGGAGSAVAMAAMAAALPSPARGRGPEGQQQHDYASLSGAAARLVVDASTSSQQQQLRPPLPSSLLPVSTAASDRRRSSLGGGGPPFPQQAGATEELVALMSGALAPHGGGGRGSSPPPGLGSGGGGGGSGGGGVLRGSSGGGMGGARRPPGLSPRAGTSGGQQQQQPTTTTTIMHPLISPKRGATTGGGSSGQSPFS